MNESGKQKLHSLLFDGESELINVKFFPGNGADFTPDVLSGAAADMLRSARDAFDRGEPSEPPTTGRAKKPILA